MPGYACDFIKDDEVWKIWHLINFPVFYADCDKGWAEGGEHYSRKPGAIKPRPAELQPDGVLPPTVMMVILIGWIPLDLRNIASSIINNLFAILFLALCNLYVTLL
jgi:hypothetical protein